MLSTKGIELARQLDSVLPVSSVLKQAAEFLGKCGWRLEIEKELIEIPKDTALIVRSHAFIKADLGDEVFLGDHLEAVLLLGWESVGENVRAYRRRSVPPGKVGLGAPGIRIRG